MPSYITLRSFTETKHISQFQNGKVYFKLILHFKFNFDVIIELVWVQTQDFLIGAQPNCLMSEDGPTHSRADCSEGLKPMTS